MTAEQADTTGVQVGDPEPWPNDGYESCPAVDQGFCTAPIGHTGPHIAAGLTNVLAVWGQE